MSFVERREKQRVSFPVLVQYRTDANSVFDAAYALDLSPGGLLIHSSLDTEEGALIDLYLVEKDGRRPLELLGVVVRTDHDRFAVRFIDLDAKQRAWLNKVVDARRETDPWAATELGLLPGFDDV